MKKGATFASVKQILLQSTDMDAENTLDNPEKITPKESAIEANGQTLNVQIAPKTFAVYVLKK